MIEELLKNKTAKEKVQIKAKELAKVKIGKFKSGELDIEVIGDIQEIAGGIQLSARAFKNKKQLGFGEDGSVDIERFNVYNPPVLIDSPTGDIIRKWKDKDNKDKERKLKYDPIEATKQDLAHTINLVGKENTNIIIGKIGHTTSTFRSVAGDNFPTDGYGSRINASENFATIRAGAGNNVWADDTNLWVSLRATGSGSNYDEMFRTIALFNTAALPDTDVISSATFSGYGSYKANGLGSTPIHLAASNPANNDALVNADYSAISRTSFGSIPYASLSASSWNVWTLNSNGRANISKTGVSKFSLQLGWDILNDTTGLVWASSQNTTLRFNAADTTGTTTDPKLIVVHSAPVTSPTVTTQAATNVQQTTCTGNGNITDTGGANATRRGFCYIEGTSGDPTTANSVAYDDGSFGTGAYTKGITGLSAGTGYRVRAYAVNSAGTGYGATVQVTTAAATVVKTIQAKARIQQSGIAKTVQAKGRVKQVGIDKTVQTKADIKQTGVAKTVQAKARLKQTESETIQTKARLKQLGVDKTVQAKARIKDTDISKIIQAKARVQQLGEETIQSKAMITKEGLKNIQAKATVQQFGTSKTIQSKADIKHPDIEKTIQSKARVRRTSVKTVQTKARLKQLGVDKTIQAKAKIEAAVVKTIQAKADIKKLGVPQTVQTKANILGTAIKTITAKANLWAFRAGYVKMRSRDQEYPITLNSDKDFNKLRSVDQEYPITLKDNRIL